MSRTVHRIVGVSACAILLLATVARAAPQAGRFPSVIPFNPYQAEFPEGVAVDKVGNVFASIGGIGGPLGVIYQFAPSGEMSTLVDFGSPSALGLTTDATGNVYVARAAEPNNGVYQVDQDGHFDRLPGTDQIVCPNAIAFDHQGTLYITETFSIDPVSGGFAEGGIWRIPRGREAELWLRDDLLTGLPPSLFSFPVGANGVAFYQGDLYTINSDKALVVRVPILPDGSAGQPEVWKQVDDVPESVLYQSPFPLQLDGIAFDVLGNGYVTVPSRAAIVRINGDDRSQETFAVYPDEPLDAPFNLAFGTGKGERENIFVTNGGYTGFLAPGPPDWPGPSLLKLEVGIPGYPVPGGGGISTISVPEPASNVLGILAMAGVVGSITSTHRRSRGR